ncbi:hypothetical protein Fcan01_28702, partial [Folsomia candida]
MASHPLNHVKREVESSPTTTATMLEVAVVKVETKDAHLQRHLPSSYTWRQYESSASRWNEHVNRTDKWGSAGPTGRFQWEIELTFAMVAFSDQSDTLFFHPKGRRLFLGFQTLPNAQVWLRHEGDTIPEAEGKNTKPQTNYLHVSKQNIYGSQKNAPLLPPQLQMWKCPLLQRPPTQEELIRHNTTRDKVISVMNCIHWEGHDPHHHRRTLRVCLIQKPAPLTTRGWS